MTPYASHAGRAVLIGGLLLVPMSAHAHAIAGARLFPATLAIDDPGVTDELSLPTFARSVDSDDTIEHDVGFEFDKTITDRFEIIVGETYSRFSGGTQGFQNLDLGAKYLATVDPEHEFILALGVASEVGGTGATAFSDTFSTLGPQVYFGKGFGDLPASFDPLRPFAVTGQFGLGVPTRARNVTITADPDGGPPNIDIEKNPSVVNWGFSLQYSLLYLDQNVHAIDAPDVFKRLIPTLEVALESPVANIPDGGHTTTGTVNPGVFYEADTYQIGVEAMVPINEASGKHPGVIAQLHFFLDDIFPTTIGRPIFQ